MTNLILGLLAIVLIVWGYCTAIPLDANFEPLKPQRTLKDLYNDIVNWFEGLNDHLALSILIVLFFSLVALVNYIIFNIK